MNIKVNHTKTFYNKEYIINIINEIVDAKDDKYILWYELEYL